MKGVKSEKQKPNAMYAPGFVVSDAWFGLGTKHYGSKLLCEQ